MLCKAFFALVTKMYLEILALSDGTTLNSTSSSSGDLPGLGTGTHIPADGAGVTHVLLPKVPTDQSR